jgi:hypothetical protein
MSLKGKNMTETIDATETTENVVIETSETAQVTETVDTSTTPDVKGYTSVSEYSKSKVNLNKELEEIVLQAIEAIENDEVIDANLDHLNLAKNHIITAFMLFNRAIFKPARLENLTLQITEV